MPDRRTKIVGGVGAATLGLGIAGPRYAQHGFNRMQRRLVHNKIIGGRVSSAPTKFAEALQSWSERSPRVDVLYSRFEKARGQWDSLRRWKGWRRVRLGGGALLVGSAGLAVLGRKKEV